MITAGHRTVELAEAWVEGDETARWRSGGGHGPDDGARESGSSLLEVPEGCRLPRHTDSVEEVVVVVAGAAEVEVEGQAQRLEAGALAVVPADAPHEVRNSGQGPLRFVAVYAGTDVVTRYEQEVQPDGTRERRPVS
jgi:quercetin dioxygenase-like cupin family protein